MGEGACIAKCSRRMQRAVSTSVEVAWTTAEAGRPRLDDEAADQTAAKKKNTAISRAPILSLPSLCSAGKLR
jgi:hypothetical protein